jgi:hypothetical protein
MALVALFDKIIWFFALTSMFFKSENLYIHPQYASTYTAFDLAEHVNGIMHKGDLKEWKIIVAYFHAVRTVSKNISLLFIDALNAATKLKFSAMLLGLYMCTSFVGQGSLFINLQVSRVAQMECTQYRMVWCVVKNKKFWKELICLLSLHYLNQNCPSGSLSFIIFYIFHLFMAKIKQFTKL